MPPLRSAEGGSRTKPGHELRFLFAALLTMVVGLLGNVAAMAVSARSLENAHRVGVENAAPSVAALDVAQVHLRRLQSLALEHRLSAPGDALGRADAIRK